LGVNWVQISDQNRLLSLSPYGKPAPPESFAGYFWMRDSAEPKVRFLWDRMQISTRPDPSDAGMAYFLATGDEQTDPAKLKHLISDHKRRSPVAARKSVRLEAENFGELDACKVEDTNDRSASHRLCVVSSSDKPAAIRTRFDEPYTATAGQYDVEIRYRSESGVRLKLLINGAAHGSEDQPVATEWTTRTTEGVEIRNGDIIGVQIEGGAARIDYVQLNLRPGS
jgi:hypothetical protein